MSINDLYNNIYLENISLLEQEGIGERPQDSAEKNSMAI